MIRVASMMLVGLAMLAGVPGRAIAVECNHLIGFAGSGVYGNAVTTGPATGVEFKCPSSVAFDTKGYVYVADPNNHVVWSISPNGIIKVFAGQLGLEGNGSVDCGDGGAADAARLKFPRGVAVDQWNDVWIADTGNNVIRRVTFGGGTTQIGRKAGNYYNVFAPGYGGDGGTAAGGTAILNGPTAVCVDDNNAVFFADTGNNAVRRIFGSMLYAVAGGNAMAGTAGFSGDGGAATAALLHGPSDLVYDSKTDCLYIADKFNHRIRKVDASGNISTVAGCSATGYAGDWGPATLAAFSWSVTGVSMDLAGNLYIADAGNAVVRKVGTDGIVMTIAGNGTTGYSGDDGPAGYAQFNVPCSVESDPSGTLFIADNNGITSSPANNNRVRKMFPSVQRLEGAFAVTPAAPLVANMVELVYTVTNTGSCDILSVTPYLDINNDADFIIPATVPTWVASVDVGVTRRFTWTFSMTGAGAVAFTVSVVGDRAIATSSFSLVAGARYLDPMLYKAGKVVVAPNSFGLDNPSAAASILLRGDSGGTVTLKVYDSAGQFAGSLAVDLQADGTKVVRYDREGWGGFKPAPGAYWVIASGGGVNDRKRLFIRRTQ